MVKTAQILLATAPPSFAVNLPQYSGMRIMLESACKSLFMCPCVQWSYLPLDVLVVLYITSSNNMRVSELLNLTPSDYIGTDRFLVRGLKRSRDYVITLHVIIQDANFRSSSSFRAPFISLSYETVWRWCKRLGIGNTPAGRKIVARTHAHRYFTASAVNQVANRASASDALHHNSKRSISSYLR